MKLIYIGIGAILLGALILVAMIFIGFIDEIVHDNKTILISEYSCENIEKSFEGICLPRVKGWMYTHCYSTEKVYYYYKLNCMGAEQ